MDAEMSKMKEEDEKKMMEAEIESLKRENEWMVVLFFLSFIMWIPSVNFFALPPSNCPLHVAV